MRGGDKEEDTKGDGQEFMKSFLVSMVGQTESRMSEGGQDERSSSATVNPQTINPSQDQDNGALPPDQEGRGDSSVAEIVPDDHRTATAIHRPEVKRRR